MSQRQDFQEIKRVASDNKTIQKAYDLLQQARPKTGPGSGFDLSKISNAMAIACAVIASELLRTNDVDPTEAQKISCLKPKEFQHCCSTIKRALQLDGDTSPGKGKTGGSLWRRLEKVHPISIDWTRFEGFLTQCKNRLRIIMAEKNVRPDEADIDCATFYWVYEIAEANQPLDMTSLARQSSARAKTVSRLCSYLDERCQQLRATIANDIAKSKAQFALPKPAAPRTSPSKRSLPVRELPTRDSKRTRVSDDAGTRVESPTKDIEMQSSDSRRVTRSGASSPSKPGQQTTTSSPAKSPVKRVQVEIVASSPVATRNSTLQDTSGDVEMTPPETPTKPFRTVITGSSKAAPTASSSSVTLDRLRGRTNPSPTRATKPSASARPPSPSPLPRHSPRKAQVAIVSEAPSTPTRLITSTSSTKAPRPIRSVTTPNKMQVEARDDSSSSSEEEDPPEPVRRRFRPVFHDRKQWEQRDPRIDRICKQAEILKEKRIEKFGYPFGGKYRPSVEAL